MNHPSGLSDYVIEQISSVLRKHPGVKQAILYGSRAKGNYRPGSDIDLTLMGEELSLEDLSLIYDEIDDLLLPYTVDLSLFARL